MKLEMISSGAPIRASDFLYPEYLPSFPFSLETPDTQARFHILPFISF